MFRCLLVIPLLATIAAAQMSPEEAMKRLKQVEAERAAPAEAPSANGTPPLPGAGAFDFARLPVGIQKQFEREADNYIRINDTIWSIELWRRQNRVSTESAHESEPYRQPDAPLFYDPAHDRRARSLRDILGPADDHLLLSGTVMQSFDDPPGRMINADGQFTFIADPPKDMPTEPKSPVMLIAKPDGALDYHLNGKPARAPRVRVIVDGRVRFVTPAELAEYFDKHNLDRLDRWQSRKVWDEPPKARTVYVEADRTSTGRAATAAARDVVGMGTSEKAEVITDPGKYHWEWTKVGQRVVMPTTSDP